VQAAKRGQTALVICSTAFATLGRSQLKALGSADLPIAVMPHPFGVRTRAEVHALAETLVDEVARLALGGSDQTAIAKSRGDGYVDTRAASITVSDDLIAFNEECERRSWSDGLPLVPPTIERVEAMLAATKRARDEIVAHIAPGFGAASVERIAINAVMAGCRPEYLPALLAAVEAVADQTFNLQGIQATTNSATPWIIVNGPLATTLGVNSGLNCLGQGNRANATLGRALRLVLQNIGGALPGQMDRATHGQPGKYTFCCAENEPANPWEPLHVECGFSGDESVVTVVGAAGTLNLNSHSKDAADLLRAIALSLVYPTSNDYHFAGAPWVILSPEHAEVLKHGGLSKDDVKRGIWEQSKMEAGRFARKDYDRAKHTREKELGGFSANTPVPIAPTPAEIGILVAGGPGTHSVYVPTFGQTRAVSRKVKP
jgi:hypothetical protein